MIFRLTERDIKIIRGEAIYNNVKIRRLANLLKRNNEEERELQRLLRWVEENVLDYIEGGI